MSSLCSIQFSHTVLFPCAMPKKCTFKNQQNYIRYSIDANLNTHILTTESKRHWDFLVGKRERKTHEPSTLRRRNDKFEPLNCCWGNIPLLIFDKHTHTFKMHTLMYDHGTQHRGTHFHKWSKWEMCFNKFYDCRTNVIWNENSFNQPKIVFRNRRSQQCKCVWVCEYLCAVYIIIENIKFFILKLS